jgi:hypothetical protein
MEARIIKPFAKQLEAHKIVLQEEKKIILYGGAIYLPLS